MKRLLSLILSAILTASTACHSHQNEKKKETENVTAQTTITNSSSESDFANPLDDVNPVVVDDIKFEKVNNMAVTEFAVNLFKESMEEGNNTLISPLSVLIALSMTANGAKEETLSQMEAVLGMPISELNNWVLEYMENLPHTEKYKLSIANSIWVKNNPYSDGYFDLKFNEDFLQTNADYYNAGVYEALFDENTCKEINQWVEENTDGMIKDILDSIPDDAVVYLINALAFDAEWNEIYNENSIHDGKFTREGGVEQDAEFMYSDENLYLEDENAVGFIKFYKDKKYAFAALLPNEGVRISDYIASLDGERLNNLLVNAETTPVDAAIPKFETKYKIEMSNALSSMGMPDAFDSSVADFTGITDGNLYISRVIHQTYINVDGKGTKAGAATVVEVGNECVLAEPENVKQVHLTRPFVYMLIDCETNIPFFIGTMMDIEG